MFLSQRFARVDDRRIASAIVFVINNGRRAICLAAAVIFRLQSISPEP